MRKLTASVMLLMAACATAQTNAPIDNFTLVTNLWWNGYKTNVLQIAEQRLAANSNDLAGLILKMEYNLAFSNDSMLSNDIFSIFATTSAIPSGVFKNHLSDISLELLDFLDFLHLDYHPNEEELEEERSKAYIIHKSMTYEDYLRWLHDDGLF